jgi:hypothetical protein
VIKKQKKLKGEKLKRLEKKDSSYSNKINSEKKIVDTSN